MSLKAEIQTWSAALTAYDEGDFDGALDRFFTIADSSKILFNIGLILATLGEHETAVEKYREAVSLDQFLAVAYFQCGVSNFLLGRYDASVQDFDDALLYLRGNQTIDYDQLGLKFRLYSCEVLFNKGLSRVYAGDEGGGMSDLQEASMERQTREHDVINDAIKDRAEGYTVFSIPVGVLYRPPVNKTKNIKTKDYLGKARLIAATDAFDQGLGFSGVEKQQQKQKQMSMKSMTSASESVPGPMEDPMRELGGARDRFRALSRSKTTVGAGTRPRNGSLDDLGPPRPLVRRPTDIAASAFANGGSRAGALLGRSASARYPGRGASKTLPRPPSPSISSPRNSPPPLLRDGAPSRSNSTSSSSAEGNLPRTPPRNTQMLPLSAGGGSGGGVGATDSQFYDDNFLDAYALDDGDNKRALPTPPPPPPPPLPPVPVPPLQTSNSTKRVEAWRQNGGERGMRPAAPPSSYYGGRSLSRRGPGPVGPGSSLGRSMSRRGPGPRYSRYDEDDDGGSQASGDYFVEVEMSRIRVKLDYRNEKRGLMIIAEASLDELVDKVKQKLQIRNEVNMKFKDEDGSLMSIIDESDWEIAVETARDSAAGRSEGKLEIWISD